jgi:cytochrome b involved in lipid metabolism
MDQEKRLAEELNKMLKEDKVPLSVSEDVHEICRSLDAGEMTINDLQGKDAFIVNSVHKAINNLNKK